MDPVNKTILTFTAVAAAIAVTFGIARSSGWAPVEVTLVENAEVSHTTALAQVRFADGSLSEKRVPVEDDLLAGATTEVWTNGTDFESYPRVFYVEALLAFILLFVLGGMVSYLVATALAEAIDRRAEKRRRRTLVRNEIVNYDAIY